MINERVKNVTDVVLSINEASLEDIQHSITSITEHTEAGTYQLIVIDTSADMTVSLYLDSLRNDKIIIRSGNDNGYTHNINIGINNSNNDIVILSVGNIVTTGWLEKLRACAYSDVTIGTVTPLSNKGFICSIPALNDNTCLPGQFTIDEYNCLVERYSFRRYPSIPAGSGFCIYIKRNVISEVGAFDEETFKDDGWDIDYCIRTSYFGYLNVLCDDTFIWNSRSSGYALSEFNTDRSSKMLLEKYPDRINYIFAFIKDNPLQDIYDNILLHQNLMNKKKNILYILHADFLEDSDNYIGGTQVHVKDLVNNISEFNFFVLVYEYQMLKLTAYIDAKQYQFGFFWNETENQFAFSNRKYKDILSNILNGFDIDLVHIQHIKNHTFDTFYMAYELGIPIYITLHDSFFICPTFLTNERGQFCEGDQKNKDCKLCLSRSLGINVDIKRKWDLEVSRILQMAQKIFAPSESLKNLYYDHFPEIIGRIQVIEHGIYGKRITKSPEIYDILKVAFIGSLSPIKGGKLAEDIIKSYKETDIEWNFFGVSDKTLTEIEQKNYRYRGLYKRDDIINLLHTIGINLVCVLTLCPESFCYTLNEALLAGIPVLTTNLGAQKDRIESTNGGWLINYKSTAQDILDTIVKIKNNKEEYYSVCSNIKRIKFQSIKSMCNAYITEYDEIPKRQIENNLVDFRFIYSAYFNSYKKLQLIGLQKKAYELDVKNFHLQKHIELIENSFSWKLMQKLKAVRFPFKSRLIKIVKRLFRR